MISFYLDYANSGKFKRYETDFNKQFNSFRLLLITTSKQRLDNMRHAITDTPFKTSNILKYFWITTFDQLSETTFNTPLWLSLHPSDQTLYAIS